MKNNWMILKFSSNNHILLNNCNFSGMIQPEFIVESLSNPDPEGFWDRYLISCPQERLCRSFELRPLPHDTVSFYALFNVIRQQHMAPVVYYLSKNAVDLFNDYR